MIPKSMSEARGWGGVNSREIPDLVSSLDEEGYGLMHGVNDHISKVCNARQHPNAT